MKTLPIDICLDVPRKKQISDGKNEVYSPYTGGSVATKA